MIDLLSLSGPSLDTLVLGAVFAAGVGLFLAVGVAVPAVQTRMRAASRLRAVKTAAAPLMLDERRARETAAASIDSRVHALSAQRSGLAARLHRAGFYAPAAPAVFTALRVSLFLAAFAGLAALGLWLLPATPVPLVAGLALVNAGAFLVLPNFVLDALGNRRQDQCRRDFPAFMDLLVVCADAGMSLEAAIDRVAVDFLGTRRALGTNVRVMTLELRAGRPLTDALDNFAKRLDFEEARTLAVLFKQSEELGTSLTHALRTYSAEMRERAITNAEEKANALPVKLMMPLGLFVFPMILVVIMLPLIVRMRNVLFV